MCTVYDQRELRELFVLGCLCVWALHCSQFHLLRRQIVAVGLLHYGLDPFLKTCTEVLQKPASEIGVEAEYFLETVVLLQEMDAVYHSVHCSYTLNVFTVQTVSALSRHSLSSMSINDDDGRLRHRHEPYYVYATLLLHAALRSHEYTALQLVRYPHPRFCVCADHRKISSCMVFMLHTLPVIFPFFRPAERSRSRCAHFVQNSLSR